MSTVKIAVLGAGSSVGTSFISLVCAKALQKYGSVSLVEASKPYFYSALAFDRRFVSREFSAVMDKIRADQAVLSPVNPEEGVQWWLRLPSDTAPLNPQHLFRLLYAPKTDYSIFDCSGLGADEACSFAAEADRVLLVIDPMPTKLMANAAFISRLLMCRPGSTLIVNKDNTGVNQKELSAFLGGKDYICVDAYPAEDFYKAEFLGRCVTDVLPEKELRKLYASLSKALV